MEMGQVGYNKTVQGLVHVSKHFELDFKYNRKSLGGFE